jgi:hypothetical protein
VFTFSSEGGPEEQSGRFAVAWVDELSSSTFHAALRTTEDWDTAWCPLTDLTPTTHYKVIIVDVALSTKAVHVVWEQNVAPSPSKFRIFYRRGRFQPTRVSELGVSVSDIVQLAQNYPNPFNSTTVMSYELGVKSWVRLVVYDLLGQEVATLVRGMQDARLNDVVGQAGFKSVQWDARLRPADSGGQASGMPSGVYYYRLIAGDRVETKKAILIR